jgi:hypothetical protein
VDGKRPPLFVHISGRGKAVRRTWISKFGRFILGRGTGAQNQQTGDQTDDRDETFFNHFHFELLLKGRRRERRANALRNYLR